MRLASHKVANKDPPKFTGPLEWGNPLIVPPKVLTALSAKGHAPTIARKPGVGLGGISMGNCTGTVRKGVKITFYSRGIDEKMSRGSSYSKKSVRIGDKATTDKAMVGLGTVATDAFQGKMKAEHSGFRSEKVLLAGKIPNSPEKSIEAGCNLYWRSKLI
jgi:hypothetical protein